MNTVKFLVEHEFVDNPVQRDTYVYDENVTNKLVNHILKHESEKVGDFILSVKESGYQVIDGLNRVKAIKDFYKSGFLNLTDVEKEKFLTCPIKIIGAPAPNTNLFSALNNNDSASK